MNKCFSFQKELNEVNCIDILISAEVLGMKDLATIALESVVEHTEKLFKHPHMFKDATFRVIQRIIYHPNLILNISILENIIEVNIKYY